MHIRSALLTSTLGAALLGTAACAQTFDRQSRNTDIAPASENQFRAPLDASDVEITQQEVAGGLEHPWGIEVLPDDAGYLVTERPGRLRHIARDGTLSDPISGVPEVMSARQGGLLDVALAPDFTDSRRVYISYSKPVSGGSATAAAYGTLSQDMTTLSDVTDIFVQTPAVESPMHFGSRIVFDGQGHVFVTTGERSAPQFQPFAQDMDKTFGKVVRLTLNGDVPSDNPFVGQEGARPEIWSLGHRNVQGAMMRGDELWTIEHGPKGGDELNLTEAGLNYGWPVITYGEQYSGGPVGNGIGQQEGLEQPVYFWDPVIAPGGMMTYDGAAFGDWDGDVMIGSLSPGGIVRLELEGGTVQAEERLMMDLGRVRDVATDSDGAILAITDDPDGSLIRLMPATSG